MKTFKTIVRKFVNLAPVIALITAFLLSSAILPTVIEYTVLRMQIHNVENEARRAGYYINGIQKVENWGEGRSEKYDNLTKRITKLISTSKVAELCNEYGAPDTKFARDITLFAIGMMWLLSAISLGFSAYAEIKYQVHMFSKKRKANVLKQVEMDVQNVQEKFGLIIQKGGSI